MSEAGPEGEADNESLILRLCTTKILKNHRKATNNRGENDDRQL